jgi:hydroxymethylbilane synthase
VELVHIRGNVDTRLRKLAEEHLDGIVVAQAGLERLGLQDAVTELLDPQWMLPAVGQGALGIECRAEDESTLQLLGRLDHPPTRLAVTAERSLLAALGGGCLVPIGALATVEGDWLSLRAAVLSPDGKQRVQSQHSGPAALAQAVGEQLAKDLLGLGARELLAG